MNDSNPSAIFLSGVTRLVDCTAAILAMLLLSPFLWVLLFLIWIDAPGRVVSHELRRGYRGKSFLMLRFRTESAATGRIPLPGGASSQSSDRQASVQDTPTDVTHFGKVLRRYGLRELPQLVNVVRGEMALFGPHPLSLAESDRLREQDPHEYLNRLEVRPGMIDGSYGSGSEDVNGFR